MATAGPRTLVHRSRIDRLPEQPPTLASVPLAGFLDAAAHAATLEVVAERPAFWETEGPWDTGWRTLSWHLVYFLVRGSCRLDDDAGGHHQLGAGSCFWLPPGRRHRLLLQPGRFYFWRFRLIDRAGRSLACAGPQVRAEARALEPLFEQLCDDLRLDHPALGHRLRALLVLFASSWDGPGPAAGSGFGPAVRRRLAQTVQERLDVGLRPAELAEAVGMSPVSFARAFRRAFGCSARRWLADQRLRAAAQRLVHGGEPVGEVAAQAGFANPSQFARRFRALFGLSPAEYRRQHAGGG
jgi:AraC-like DNA-binding protein